jgi:RNA polymerase sigma factor (TIGR02999 family)
MPHQTRESRQTGHATDRFRSPGPPGSSSLITRQFGCEHIIGAGGRAMTAYADLIQNVVDGKEGARDQLFAAAYPELRKLARSRLHQGGRHALLETTALVHECYLRFLGGRDLQLRDRQAFFAYASQAMRSVVIDSVRERRSARQGGPLDDLTLDSQIVDGLPAAGAEILHVHEALLALEQAEPRLAKVVEMRYFGGYTEAEIAEALNLTERTVRRDWDKARLLLMTALRP